MENLLAQTLIFKPLKSSLKLLLLLKNELLFYTESFPRL